MNRGGCRKFLCSFCPMSFRLKSYLKRHVSTQHRADQQQLTHVDVDHLQIHDNVEQPEDDFFKCPLCEKTLKTQGSLMAHTIVKHSTATSANTVMQCPICKKILKRMSDFSVHINQHLPERKKNFPCNKCRSSFYQKVHLKSHMQTKHFVKLEIDL